ncbi:MAG TPA: hypothetical protein VJC07_00735 [Candidatus Nanoarchaeia archaeon]|nr:hypothetical protein [Candidatus Nanoarchaeia archaeon]
MTTSTDTKSLVELLGEERPNTNDVLASLRNYSENGASILADSVIAILGKTAMTQVHLSIAWAYLEHGRMIHEEMASRDRTPAERKEAAEYAAARDVVASRIRAHIEY